MILDDNSSNRNSFKHVEKHEKFQTEHVKHASVSLSEDESLNDVDLTGISVLFLLPSNFSSLIHKPYIDSFTAMYNCTPDNSVNYFQGNFTMPLNNTPCTGIVAYTGLSNY